MRLTSMRATGQVSAHDHGFVECPVAMVRVERALQQQLRQQRLGVDVGALTEQNEAGDGEKDGTMVPRILFIITPSPRHCERSEAIQGPHMEHWIASSRSLSSAGIRRPVRSSQ